jgi:hypothetical protein
MSMSTTTRRLSYLGVLTASAIGLAALTTPLQPAQAQGYLGFSVGPFGFGIGAPPPVYYNYPRPYPYDYYAPAYYPAYYPGYYVYPRW